MPFYLEEADVSTLLDGVQSVLLVPCRFCPAASLAVREKKPFLEPLRHFLRTDAYESHIRDLRRRLEDGGIRTALFDARMPYDFLPCMWTNGRRKALSRRAKEFDAVVVLGCDAAAEIVRDLIGQGHCRVITGMSVVGIMSVAPSVTWPLKVTLSMKGITSVGAEKPAERAADVMCTLGDRDQVGGGRASRVTRPRQSAVRQDNQSPQREPQLQAAEATMRGTCERNGQLLGQRS